MDHATEVAVKRPLPSPPPSRGIPLLGSALPLLRDPLSFLREQYAELGPVFDLVAPGRNISVIAGTGANRFVATQGRDCLASGPFWGALDERHGCPHSIIALDGDDHRKLRKLFADDLSREVVGRHADGITELTRQAFAEHLTGSDFQVRDMCRLLVSRQVHHLLTQGDSPVPLETARALMEVFRYETNVLLLGKWPRFAFAAPVYRRSRALATAFIDTLIQDAERRKPDSGWFATVLQGREAYPELFADGGVGLNFLLPFVAGVDTVGSTLAFVLYELTRDSALRERVRDAVDACVEQAGGTPSVNTLKNLGPLRGLIMEGLRLYPAAFGIYRRATRDFEFDGHRIRGGSDVLVFTSSTHTDPDCFPDPYRFDIDRFAKPRQEHKGRFVYAPYGGGPHVCLGAGMGEGLMSLTVATWLREFDLEAENPHHRMRFSYDPSLSVDPGFRIRVRPRALS